MDPKKTLEKALAGSRNIRFGDLVSLAQALGFVKKRTSGSHTIFSHPDIPKLLNIQDASGQAKPYQVRQLLRLVEMYDLRIGESE